MNGHAFDRSEILADRNERDQFLAHHYASPIPEEHRSDFVGADYYDFALDRGSFVDIAIGDSDRCGVIVIIRRPTASRPIVPVVMARSSLRSIRITASWFIRCPTGKSSNASS